MTRVQRYIAHPPRRVWDALLDPTSWWESPDRPVEVVVGTRFSINAYPVLGTRFTGVFEVEILDAVPCERLTTSLVALARPEPGVRWERQTTFEEHEGGTLLTLVNLGVDTGDRDERILLGAVKQIQGWELDGVAKLLDRGRTQSGDENRRA